MIRKGPPPTVISVRAPAKINLILRILDRRADGFHNLWSLMHTVRLEDEIVIRFNEQHRSVTLQCDTPSLVTDQTNLVYRAAVAVLQHRRRDVGLDIVLHKRIPVGAGLGGGSSDAAATIVGLNELLGLGMTAREMVEIGQTLGSDVPFFFVAPSAFVSGRGEQVSPVRVAGPKWIVLINPGFPVETRWAYARLSSTRSEVRPLSAAHAALALQSELSWPQLLPHMENDFERPVFEAHPLLEDMRRRLLEEGAEAALLSGSGATVFGVFAGEPEALRAAARFQADPQLKVYPVPVGCGPLLAVPDSTPARSSR